MAVMYVCILPRKKLKSCNSHEKKSRRKFSLEKKIVKFGPGTFITWKRRTKIRIVYVRRIVHMSDWDLLTYFKNQNPTRTLSSEKVKKVARGQYLSCGEMTGSLTYFERVAVCNVENVMLFSSDNLLRSALVVLVGKMPDFDGIEFFLVRICPDVRISLQGFHFKAFKDLKDFRISLLSFYSLLNQG